MSGVGDARQLNAAALRGLLARIDKDPTRAADRYEALRQTLQQYFTWRNALDPEACADETLDRVARRLHEGAEVDRLRPFIYGVARLVLHEEHRRIAARPLPFHEVAQVAASHSANAPDITADCLERCLEALGAVERDLVLRYYQSDARARIDGRQAIAGELGVTVDALRSRVQRIRNRLETCATRCRRAAEAAAERS